MWNCSARLFFLHCWWPTSHSLLCGSMPLLSSPVSLLFTATVNHLCTVHQSFSLGCCWALFAGLAGVASATDSFNPVSSSFSGYILPPICWSAHKQVTDSYKTISSGFPLIHPHTPGMTELQTLFGEMQGSVTLAQKEVGIKPTTLGVKMVAAQCHPLTSCSSWQLMLAKLSYSMMVKYIFKKANPLFCQYSRLIFLFIKHQCCGKLKKSLERHWWFSQ